MQHALLDGENRFVFFRRVDINVEQPAAAVEELLNRIVNRWARNVKVSMHLIRQRGEFLVPFPSRVAGPSDQIRAVATFVDDVVNSLEVDGVLLEEELTNDGKCSLEEFGVVARKRKSGFARHHVNVGAEREVQFALLDDAALPKSFDLTVKRSERLNFIVCRGSGHP